MVHKGEDDQLRVLLNELLPEANLLGAEKAEAGVAGDIEKQGESWAAPVSNLPS
jgi:hypothetical protein